MEKTKTCPCCGAERPAEERGNVCYRCGKVGLGCCMPQGPTIVECSECKDEGRAAMEKLLLTTRVDKQNARHTFITVFQNGGNAGVLCVDTKHAQEVLMILNGLGEEDVKSDIEYPPDG